jgi:hypothetical protein
MNKIIAFVLCGAFLGHAQATRPNSTSYYDSDFDGIIAQFVDGANWKTIVTLINLDTTPGTYTLTFYTDDGSPMSVQTTAGSGSTITGAIPVGGSLVIETPGTKSALSQGWALLQTSNNTGGNAIFRQSIPGRPQYEASLPITTYVNARRYALPFDQVTSTTGVALVNPVSFTSIPVSVTLRDTQGNQIGTDTFNLNPLQHMAFALANRYPQIAGKRGVVEFSTSAISLGVLVIRFGTESFTSILPFTSLVW